MKRLQLPSSDVGPSENEKSYMTLEEYKAAVRAGDGGGLSRSDPRGGWSLGRWSVPAGSRVAYGAGGRVSCSS